MELLGVVTLLLTTALAVLVWKLIQFLIRYRRVCLAAAKFHVIGPLHPVWGNLHLFKRAYEWFAYLRRVVVQDRPKVIITWMTSLFPRFTLVHPDPIKVVLKAPAIPKPTSPGSPYGGFVAWLGYGLLFSSGAKWQRNRKMLTPAFHFDTLRPYVDTYNDVSDILIRKLETSSDGGKSVEITKPAGLATLDVLLRCMLSYESDILDQGDDHPYAQAVDQLTRLAAERLLSMLPSTVTQIGLVDRYLLSQLHDGHDTTASAFSWTMFCLSKYPAYQEKVYEELKRIMQNKEKVAWEDFPKMKLLMLFIKESMRMYSPAPMIGRTLDEPLDIEGITLPESTNMSIMIDCLNHHPDVWPDHDEFKLHRFEDNIANENDPFSYIPFSAGPRNCIGQNFAIFEFKVLLARILIKFRVELDTDHEVVPISEVVMKAKDGIKIKFYPR